MKCITVELELL